MKPASIAALLFSTLLVLPQIAFSCISDKREPMQNIRYSPQSGSMNHWPAETIVNVGSIMSFLTPIDAKIELHFQQKGMMAPLTILTENSHEQMRVSPDISPHWVDIDYDTKKWHWVHIHAGSFGVTDIQISAPNWSKKIKVTSYYPSPLESNVPPVELVLDGAVQRLVSVTAHDNIEVTVPGTVADGWSASLDSENGFRLLRVIEVWKLGGVPQVKLFFYGNGSPKNSTIILRRNNGEGPHTFEFNIQARPAVTC